MVTLLSELLARVAAESPDQVAVEDNHGHLTYRQLADRAARVAGALRAQGVGPGARLGVCMAKSCHSVAAIYGALYSGAAYVPLDVAAPTARLAYMIENCRMEVLLVDSGQLARVSEMALPSSLRSVFVVGEGPGAKQAAEKPDVPVIFGEAIEAHAPIASPLAVAPDDPAYVLYTSGSTGQPKGVVISHENALAFVRWAREEVGVEASDRVSSHAPFHFDLSIFDLYVSSLAQATVVLVPDGTSYFPAALARWIDQQRISVWYSVPSVLVQLLEQGRADRFGYQALRRVIFAGEVFAPKFLRAWMHKVPQAAFYNFYGPTETNVCTSYRVQEAPVDDAPIPIGRPASGDRILLLDESDREIAKPDVIGELCVDGPTVALGYWDDEAKTRSRFVSLPEVVGHARPIYRTGDRAFRDERGDLHFRGRRDQMIKSRGYRIELGEIESAASAHPAVREVCVVAIPDAHLGSRMRAYVGLHSGAALDREALCHHMLERLPRYALPQEFCFAESLPKTSTGKIDRQKLSAETGEAAACH